MIKKIIKENGKFENYETNKAAEALYRAMQDCKGVRPNKSAATKLTKKIEKNFKDAEFITSKEFADTAIKVLKQHNKALSEHYAQKRKQKSLNRLRSSKLMNAFKDILESNDDDPESIKTENANIAGGNPAAMLHRIGSETNKEYVLDYVFPKDISKAHREQFIHLHDLDYGEISVNCLQLDAKAALKDGYNTGTSKNNEPKSILIAAMLSAIALQSSTNEMFGGQSLANLDYALAKYVNISFRKYFMKAVKNYYELNDSTYPKELNKKVANKLYYGVTVDNLKEVITDNQWIINNSKLCGKFLALASKETVRETEQAMQSLCHNLSTLKSRAADQVPFSSVNIGLDTSAAGRLVTQKLLETLIKGAGEEETFIYPIVIFHVLEGINYRPSDKNYDLFKLAMRSSSERLYPNYNFVDTPTQFQFIRDKKGKLLWLAKENWYIKQGFITKKELDDIKDENDIVHSNLNERIRVIQRIERNLAKHPRKNKDIIFDTYGFLSGMNNIKLVTRAHKLGVEQPVEIDKLCAGIDDRTIPTRMGCRTYVESDNLVECDSTQEPKNYKFERTERPPYGVTFGRGNFSFTTLNLPRYAIEAVKSVKGGKLTTSNAKIRKEILSKFYELLLRYIILAKQSLRYRQQIIGDKPAKNFEFIIGQHMILGTNDIKPEDKTYEVWEHFSKSIGYIGLYETMQILYKKDQVELPEEAFNIILFMRRVIDNLSKGYYVLPTDKVLKDDLEWYKHIFDVNLSTQTAMDKNESDWDKHYKIYDINDNQIFVDELDRQQIGNWSLFATPAESTCYAFCKVDTEDYGKIKNVTDKGYYTNSNHVDVRKKITVHKKIQIEAPYHTLANAGNIFYIETDGAIGKNIAAYKAILDEMHDGEVTYCGINSPTDYCCLCHRRGVIPEGETCRCGSTEIIRYRRITGYLVGDISRWGKGKRLELKNRVKHDND